MWVCEDPDDEATYHVRQLGKVVWWSGASRKDDGAYFTNVFKGTLEFDGKVKPGEPGYILVKGEWADVRGSFTGSGTLTLEVVNPKEGAPATEFRRTSVTGGFGGKTWKREEVMAGQQAK